MIPPNINGGSGLSVPVRRSLLWLLSCLSFLLISLLSLYRLAPTVELFAQNLFPTMHESIPACWEQAIQPTFYHPFLEPGASTAARPAFILEPFDLIQSETDYLPQPYPLSQMGKGIGAEGCSILQS